MGGTIGVSSVEGLGSRFWFTVRMNRIESAPPVAEVPDEPPRSANGRILVVDDIPMNLEIARAVLETAGHRVEEARDGADAIDAVALAPYDLVLMDVQMPVLDGIAAMRRIRALPPPACDIPILAMTADVLPDRIAGLLAAGMDGHVAKPFRREELLGAVARTLRSGRPVGADARAAWAVESGVNRRTLARLHDVLPPAAVSALVTRLRRQIVEGPLSGTSTADRTGLAPAARSLISSADLLGFERLAHLCRTLDDAVLAGTDDDALRKAVAVACRDALAVIDGDLSVAAA